MQEFEITWRRALPVFWLILWRGILGALAIGVGVGFVLGVIGVVLGWSGETGPLVSASFGALVASGWYFVVVRMALKKKYGEFRIALVPRT